MSSRAAGAEPRRSAARRQRLDVLQSQGVHRILGARQNPAVRRELPCRRVPRIRPHRSAWDAWGAGLLRIGRELLIRRGIAGPGLPVRSTAGDRKSVFRVAARFQWLEAGVEEQWTLCIPAAARFAASPCGVARAQWAWAVLCGSRGFRGDSWTQRRLLRHLELQLHAVSPHACSVTAAGGAGATATGGAATAGALTAIFSSRAAGAAGGFTTTPAGGGATTTTGRAGTAPQRSLGNNRARRRTRGNGWGGRRRRDDRRRRARLRNNPARFRPGRRSRSGLRGNGSGSSGAQQVWLQQPQPASPAMRAWRASSSSSFFLARMAFITSPGLEMCERSILGTMASAPWRACAPPACDADFASRAKCARTFSASSSSSELECVLPAATPSSGRTSRIARDLTSSSFARSLIRTLLIRLFSICAAKSPLVAHSYLMAAGRF